MSATILAGLIQFEHVLLLQYVRSTISNSSLLATNLEKTAEGKNGMQLKIGVILEQHRGGKCEVSVIGKAFSADPNRYSADPKKIR